MSTLALIPMASNRHQRAGALGGRAAASELQNSEARRTILITRPWERREYEVLIVLKNSPNTDALEALYLQHGLKALVTVSVSCLGYLVSITVIQRRDFLPSDVEKILEILERFKVLGTREPIGSQSLNLFYRSAHKKNEPDRVSG